MFFYYCAVYTLGDKRNIWDSIWPSGKYAQWL